MENLTVTNPINYWFYISIIEAIIILFLLLSLFFNKRNKINEKKEIIETKIDFNNILNSSFNSKEIYDELKKKYHPDRYVHDIEKQNIATEIFQEITKNKNNIKKLQELKKLAEQKL